MSGSDQETRGGFEGQLSAGKAGTPRPRLFFPDSLLSEFRDAYATHGAIASFCIQATPSLPDFGQRFGEIVGMVFLPPTEGRGCHFSYWLSVVCIGGEHEGAETAAREFLALAAKAGAHLPAEYRRSLGQKLAEPAALWCLALLRHSMERMPNGLQSLEWTLEINDEITRDADDADGEPLKPLAVGSGYIVSEWLAPFPASVEFLDDFNSGGVPTAGDATAGGAVADPQPPVLQAGPAGDASDGDGQGAVLRCKWQDVAERLKRLQAAGEPFPGYRDLAARIGAGPSTVFKAVEQTPSLRCWAKRTNASAPKTKHLNDVIVDRTPQQREPDPAELGADSELLTSRDALDAALAYCIDEAPAAVKAKIHEMTPEQKDNLARAALKHPERMAEILKR